MYIRRFRERLTKYFTLKIETVCSSKMSETFATRHRRNPEGGTQTSDHHMLIARKQI